MNQTPKPKHCAQNWLEMNPANGGRLCAQCSKVIVDFSKMNWTEIEKIQTQNNNAVCGMYNPKQLEYWGQEIPKKTNKLKRFIVITSLGISLTTIGNAQTGSKDSIVIEGRVIDSKTGEPLPFASLKLKNSDIGFSTDVEGYFKKTLYYNSEDFIPDTIRVSYLGYYENQIVLKSIRSKTSFINGKPKLQIEMDKNPNAGISFYVTMPSLEDRIRYKFRKWFRKEA